jgi:hypothetical protein
MAVLLQMLLIFFEKNSGLAFGGSNGSNELTYTSITIRFFFISHCRTHDWFYLI